MTNSLLQIMFAEREDDKPRQVIADWFEQEGQTERATFIRLQLQRAALPRSSADAVRLELQERALLAEFDQAWRSELPQLEGVRWGGFHRGFVDKVAFDDVVALQTHADECMAATPVSSLVIRWPRLEDRPALPTIPGISELTVVGTLMQVDDIDWLANSDLLATVEILNLVETQMEVDALERLLASPHLSRLRALRMPLHNFGNAGLELLLRASLPALRELDVSVATQDELGSGGRYLPTIDDAAIPALLAWPGLAQLEALNLTGNQIGLTGLQSLLRSPAAAGLKVLRLRSVSDWDWDTETRPNVLEAFGSTDTGMRLRELDIGENQFSERAAELLASSPAIAQLELLGFDYIQADAGFATLTAAPWFDTLQILSAHDSNPQFIEAVMQRSPKQLHTLELTSHYYWSQMRDVPQILAAGPALPSLLALDLMIGRLTDPELEVLGGITTLPNLLSLRIGDAMYDDDNDDQPEQAGLAGFVESALGKQLVSLQTGTTRFDRLPAAARVAMGRGEYRGPLRYL